MVSALLLSRRGTADLIARTSELIKLASEYVAPWSGLMR